MALSFLSLPPEVRVQIYRYLLCHHYWIQPDRWCYSSDYSSDKIIARTRGMKLLPSFEPGPRTKFSLGFAVLRTCRIIYAEAMPVLYGENSFNYNCYTHVLYQADYPKAHFPGKTLDFTKHVELAVQEDQWNDQSFAKDIAATILYFARGCCVLHTFKLSLYELTLLSKSEKYPCHHLIDNLCTSSELAASLAALQVSECLTISVWRCPFADYCEKEIAKEARDKCQGIVNRLASAKSMTATMEEEFFERDDELIKLGFDDWVCNISWCLRPQRSQPQSSKMTSISD